MRLSVTVAYNKSDLVLGWSHSIAMIEIFLYKMILNKGSSMPQFSILIYIFEFSNKFE